MQNLSHSVVLLAALALPAFMFERPPSQDSAVAPAAVNDLDAALASLREARALLLASAEPIDPARLTAINEVHLQIARTLRDMNHRVDADARASAPRPAADAHEQARLWVDEIQALGEGSQARREAALAEVRAALLGADESAQFAALRMLQRVGAVAYDKESFRPLVLPFATTARGMLLVPALYALLNTSTADGDIELVYAAWERDRAALSNSILNLLSFFGGRRLEGRSEDIALEALAGHELHRHDADINGLWGTRVGPRLEARVLELASNDDPDIRHDAIYFGLSTFTVKSPAVVEALIDTLVDPDVNNSGRALWGLGHGVPAASHARVVDALVELHNGRSSPSVRADCRRIVGMYGGEAGLARLAQ